MEQARIPRTPPSTGIGDRQLMTQQQVEHLVDQLMSVAGYDSHGRPVLVLYACHLPPHRTVPYDELLRLLLARLASTCANNYVLLYFATTNTSSGGKGTEDGGGSNVPPWTWLYSTYTRLPRIYRKNIQSLVIIHPSRWPKWMIKTMAAVVSPKFARKVVWVERLYDLKAHVEERILGGLHLPSPILEHDRRVEEALAAPPRQNAFLGAAAALLSKRPAFFSSSTSASSSAPAVGGADASLLFGRDLALDMGGREGAKGVPPAVRECAAYIRSHGLQAEGLFRASPAMGLVEEAKRATTLPQLRALLYQPGGGGAYLAAYLLKMYVRDMREPFFPPDTYPQLQLLQARPGPSGTTGANGASAGDAQMRALCASLPPYKRAFAHHLFSLLAEVSAASSRNLMTPSNLAIVWAPNFLRGPDAMVDFDLSSRHLCTWVRLGIEHPDRYFGQGTSAGGAAAAGGSSSGGGGASR